MTTEGDNNDEELFEEQQKNTEEAELEKKKAAAKLKKSRFDMPKFTNPLANIVSDQYDIQLK